MEKIEENLKELEAHYNKMREEELKLLEEKSKLYEKIEAHRKELQKQAKKPILKIACFSKQNPCGPALCFHFLAVVDLNEPKKEFYMIHEEDEFSAESFKENFYELVDESNEEGKPITPYDIKIATEGDIESTMIEGCRDDSTEVILCIEEIDKQEFDNKENLGIPIYRESYDSDGNYDAGITWR